MLRSTVFGNEPRSASVVRLHRLAGGALGAGGRMCHQRRGGTGCAAGAVSDEPAALVTACAAKPLARAVVAAIVSLKYLATPTGGVPSVADTDRHQTNVSDPGRRHTHKTRNTEQRQSVGAPCAVGSACAVASACAPPASCGLSLSAPSASAASSSGRSASRRHVPRVIALSICHCAQARCDPRASLRRGGGTQLWGIGPDPG